MQNDQASIMITKRDKPVAKIEPFSKKKVSIFGSLQHKTEIKDTHVLIWAFLQPNQIGEETKNLIDLAQDNNQLMISSITLWEIAMLNMKKRINIYEPIRDFLDTIVNVHRISVQNITAAIASEGVNLADNFHGNPAE
eukprot:gene752-932_t